MNSFNGPNEILVNDLIRKKWGAHVCGWLASRTLCMMTDIEASFRGNQ